MTQDKQQIYKTAAAEIAAVIDGEGNQIARMATIVCVLNQHFDQFFWTGFYLVDSRKDGELVIGPYQGTLGCLRIKFGQGVCGTAAANAETIIVPDVHAFDGHIACDPRSNSEIVVPLFDKAQNLIGVLDIDSTELDSFDETDKAALENILADSFSR